MLKRHAHNLSHTKTSTNNMGLVYPSTLFEVFPGDSFRVEAANLTRFLPQVAPTMHDVFVGVDTYQVPWRQLFDKLGISWDDFLTGGEDGMANPLMPTVTIPATGFESGSLADFLGLPTNYIDPDTGNKVIVGAGLQVCALPIVCYMHIINENYRDQNFVKKLDLTKYEDFINGAYEFQDASGNPLGYNLLVDGIFPKAWSRDYFGRALPNTQRGPQAMLPITGDVNLTPPIAPVITKTVFKWSEEKMMLLGNGNSNPALWRGFSLTFLKNVAYPVSEWIELQSDNVADNPVLKMWCKTVSTSGIPAFTYQHILKASPDTVIAGLPTGWTGGLIMPTAPTYTAGGQYADLSNIEGIQTTAASIIAFRIAARMQAFGEVLQTAGARAVEFTLAMFGVRIPDERIQRPIFHGSFRLPIVFSEVLQTSSTDGTSPQGNLAGHGITGGKNQPLHIKVIEHGYVMSVMHIMPRSQYQNILPKMYLRSSRFDIPNPIFQHVGEQDIKRVEIYPNSANGEESFGFVPRYSELMHIPSTLHGHMKDTFLHWTMARLYNKGEPVLSAAWRYEKPTDRSFSVRDEDQMQICIGYTIHGRRVFARNPRPGIHIV